MQAFFIDQAGNFHAAVLQQVGDETGIFDIAGNACCSIGLDGVNNRNAVVVLTAEGKRLFGVD